MSQDDVSEVARVERRCFSNPWPSAAYRRELRLPDQNYYLVIRQPSADGAVPDKGDPAGRQHANGHGHGRLGALPRLRLPPFGRGHRGPKTGSAGPVVGFAGMWHLYDEAHITTIGVDPAHRGHGLGEWLLAELVTEAIARGAGWLTLEVRVSNVTAQRLYSKYGFTVKGTRHAYYSDDNEDAYVMWSPSLRESANLHRFAALRRAIHARVQAAADADPGADPGAESHRLHPFGVELAAER